MARSDCRGAERNRGRQVPEHVGVSWEVPRALTEAISVRRKAKPERLERWWSTGRSVSPG